MYGRCRRCEVHGPSILRVRRLAAFKPASHDLTSVWSSIRFRPTQWFLDTFARMDTRPGAAYRFVRQSSGIYESQLQGASCDTGTFASAQPEKLHGALATCLRINISINNWSAPLPDNQAAQRRVPRHSDRLQ
ncbi:hypothetical protein MPL3365_140200 [Mesorhizobium plurifarium]|uniref:Uncharacterized protein n=1 Tax=Mesorhizobium plurifarium TaxID=69974 RepID=A0A090GT43_MESPL|nr:hypothetical protein MPL3365_140200 [Mesorhizobium plurifarium]